MKVLLSDGSGLTARQCATRLDAAGHVVEVLSPDPLCLCRFTRHVARLHLVPPYGPDPLRWLAAALDVYRSGRFDVLFPTQEQVAVLSRGTSQLDAASVATVVPPFAALSAVQDKIAAWRTLRRLGIPQPEAATEAEGWDRFPAFVKDPISTASCGVRQVANRTELDHAATGRTVLVQAAVDGRLAMCQSVFDAGSLVAFHANERTAEGAGGGASHKRSISLPEVRRCFETLGKNLHWHGALSADVILGSDGPSFIDVNPRLVEPQNAYLCGVDLVGAMLELATGGHPAVQVEGTTGVATHQWLLAVLGAAQHGRGRRGVMAEVVHGARRSRDYLGSSEELTPLGHDMRGIIPVAMAAVATLVAPTSFSWFVAGSVANYAVSEQGWQDIVYTDLSAPHFDPPRQPTARGGGASRSRLGRASRTAALMAVQRGLESTRPAGKRLFADPLARSFLPPSWRAALTASRLGAVRAAIEATYDLVGGPGPRASAIARTRLIDDLVEEIAPTVEQVVLLGAGYDTRPYRLSCLARPKVFEVDHAATQAAKRAILSRAGVNTSGVVFVAVDFETDDLAGALANARYAADRPTLFVWEGVTQYLSAEAVDNTLAVVHKIAHAGGRLVFTYVDREVLRSPTRFPEGAKWLQGVSKRGEPWVFGLSPQGLPDFLAARGFRLAEDLSTADAGTRYFVPLGRRERGSGLYRVATSVIDPKTEAGH
ncbi:MAG TPA: SAM-dependent methyltransferase [Acidimicrobiales bacterium]|nr:SAM-dependent methyltransferase [Acidimicrobiales bacterium]